MQSAVDISQDNSRLLSTLELDEVFEIVADIISKVAEPAALAILMWDGDLESFSDMPVFGARKKDFAKFVEFFARDCEEPPVLSGEMDVDEIGPTISSELMPVFCYPVKHEEQLCACILIAGADNIEYSALEEELAARPLSLSLSHAWEYRELKRENQRLRGQYEHLEDSIRSMEEQTRKIIHDMMAKDALHTRKVERERLVYGISNAVRSSVKIQEVLQNAVNQIGKSFGVTHCLLLRPINTDEQMVVFEYHDPFQVSIKELFTTESGRKFTNIAMGREAPQALEHPEVDSQILYDKEFLRQLGLLSGLIIPLVLREQVLGVIFLQQCISPKEWSIDDTALLGSLADQLSVAIENADLHEERERQAVTDGLTGVANRRHFNDVFQREFERARRYDEPLSLIVSDLDFLKKVNDTYGHQAGDEAIKAIARVMTQSSRSIDLVARYGGEEFCLLLPKTDLEMALQIAERLRRLVNETKIEGPGCISASIGVASFPKHADDPDALFHQADEALYAAKQGGRNQVCIASGKT